MSTIQFLLTSWLALGLLLVAAAEFSCRRRREDGPLSQSSALASAALTLTLIVGAPVAAIFLLAEPLKMLWQGRVPVIGKIWWPARVRQVDRRNCIASEGAFSRAVIICDMVDVRKKRDPRLLSEEPWQWEESERSSAPEAVILEEVLKFHWLRDGGFSELEAVSHLQSLDGTGNTDLLAMTLRALIERKLSIADPAYLDLDSDVLTKSLSLAATGARKRLDQIKSSPYPPDEWLADKIGYGEPLPPLFKDFSPPTLDDKQWRYFKARMTHSDELRLFCSPGDTWVNLTGRAGVALVRNGRAIAHFVTVLN